MIFFSWCLDNNCEWVVYIIKIEYNFLDDVIDLYHEYLIKAVIDFAPSLTISNLMAVLLVSFFLRITVNICFENKITTSI